MMEGYTIGVYAGNLVISHHGDTMVVEAFAKPKSWTPFHDLLLSLSHHDQSIVIEDDTLVMDGVIMDGIDDTSWFSKSYITTGHGGTDGLRKYYHMVRIMRGDAPMAPFTRLKAVSTDNEYDGGNELDELGRTVISSFSQQVNQDEITMRV